MAFEISVDDEALEDLVQKYVESRINVQVSDYLKHSLKGIIEARLAKMNLTGGKSVDVEDIISEALAAVIDKRIRMLLPDLIKQEVSRRFAA